MKKKIKQAMSLSSAALTVMSAIPMSLVASVADAYANETTETNIQTNSQEKTQPTYRNVMYYGDWSIYGGQGNYFPKDMPADQYTHINFAFVDMDSNGDLLLPDQDAAFASGVGSGHEWGSQLGGIIPALAALREKNPNIKTGISLGGWSKSGDFSKVAADPIKRAKYVKNVMQFLKYTDMDFIDVDWEYPNSVRQPDLVDNKNDEGTPDAGPQDRENYLTLMQDLRNALDKQGAEIGKTYELSTAIHGAKEKLEEHMDVKRLFDIIDFGNVMTYDLHGAWDEKAGHQTALYTNPNDPTSYSIDAVVDYLLGKNVDPKKIVIGAAFYTRGWDTVEKGGDASRPGLFQPASATNKDADGTASKGANNEAPAAIGDGGRMSGVWSYRSIDKLKAQMPDLKEYWDEEAQAPFMYSESTKDFYTFDNVRSVTAKAEYVKKHQLGGMISWMASQDKATNNSAVRDELTKAIKEGLFGKEALPVQKQDYDLRLDVDMAIRLGSTDSGKKGFELTLKNNEVLENYAGNALQPADKFYSTVKRPKLIFTLKDGATLARGDYKAGAVTVDGDKSIVDLSAVYDGRFLTPGNTYTFKLVRNDSQEVSPDQIESVVLEQYYDDKTQLSSQTIIGEAESNQAPVISGVGNQTITVGESFDPLAGVTATDKEDGDLTSQIKVTGKVDTAKEGNYPLTYSVTDSDGNETIAKRVITVEKKEISNEKPQFFGVNNQTITVGESFDPLAGVTATDKEDGNLTKQIKVTGSVDTTKAGVYTLAYSVTDSDSNTTRQERTITVKQKATVDFGVGQGIQWPAQVMAPFVDMTAYVSDREFSNNGAPNLAEIAKQSETKFFNLGFMQATGVVNGRLNWSWGGFNGLNELTNDQWQYEGIKKAIRELREEGGDVALSFGGLNSGAFWELTQDVTILTNAYQELIEGYGLTRIDLDVEVGAMDYQHNKANAKAIKKVQELTGVKVTLTLPVMPTGLIQTGLDVLKAYLEEGVDLENINIMTMCYGASVPDYAKGSIDAVDNTMKQVKDYFKKYAGIDLTTEQAYAKLGTTPSVGFENTGHPYFTTEMMKQVVDHAVEKNIGMVSFWSINRDAKIDNGVGQVKNRFEFTKVAQTFGESDIEPDTEAPTTPKNLTASKVTHHSVALNWEAATDNVAVKEYLIFRDGNKIGTTKTTSFTDTTVEAEKEYAYRVQAIDAAGNTSALSNELTVQTEKMPVDNQKPTAPSNLSILNITEKSTTVSWKASTDNVAVSHYIVNVTGKGLTTEKPVTSLNYSITGLQAGEEYKVTVRAVDISGNESDVVSKSFVTKEESTETIPQWDPNKIYLGGEKVMFEGKEYVANHWTLNDRPSESGQWGPWSLVTPEASEKNGEWNTSAIYLTGQIVTLNGQTYRAKWWNQNVNPETVQQWGAWEKI
ncbi:glycosyl hydrolase family 18 protein [Enterococcus durans]|uniref:glycosyl hydrolase family 18 protein n=1 Tax=Enterococcus durans TaxID=53345 RepID=UPI0019643F31|nr:glycosyl hydrolase family 18 protein [Enterococcus durans]